MKIFPIYFHIYLSFFCGITHLVQAQNEAELDGQEDAFSLLGNVSRGEVDFVRSDNEFQITASDGAVISYFNFDIPAGETVRFIQPGSDATVINRIDSLIPAGTQIDGNLYANGKVVLLNPGGIMFGEDAMVDVGKLHAIGGSELQFSYQLSGDVTNQGTIQAGEVVLAGTKVENSGTILVEGGTLVMAAGSSLELFTEDNTLSVSIANDSPLAPVGSASDIAGQAILQSGIVQASKVQLEGRLITHNGNTNTDSFSVKNYTNFSGNDGKVVTAELSISGSSEISGTTVFSMEGTGNQIGKISASGNHQDVKIRSQSSLQVGESPTVLDENEQVDFDPPVFSVQNLDLRVGEGDLTLYVLPVPTVSTSDNSLLLAGENNLVLSSNLESLAHARKILYGRNLSVGSIDQEAELSLGSTVSLDAVSVTIEDLSPTLSPSVLQSLASDNPTFTGFDSKGGLVEISQMTERQLTTLFKYGLFTGYSYFLQAPDKSATLANELADSGGNSALFGGSFAVVASASAGAGASSGGSGGDVGSDSSGESDSDGGGDSDDSSGDGSGSSAGGTAASVQGVARAIGVAPFAPISTPILSVEASEILDQALSPEVEQKMQKYLKP